MSSEDDGVAVVSPDMQVFALHRYFISANRMRDHFDRLLAAHVPSSQVDYDVEEQIYMSQWYAGLHVVVEGWIKLGLSDDHIDLLLSEAPGPDMTDLLRRYRNGVYHFQPNYWDGRFTDLWLRGAESAVWIRSLNSEFGRWFHQWFAARQES